LDGWRALVDADEHKLHMPSCPAGRLAASLQQLIEQGGAAQTLSTSIK
jgi:hypothetical protein